MELKKENKKYLPFIVTSLLISFLFGAFTFFLVDRNKPINADRILNHVKKEFREEGPIEGSWIEMTKVPWSKHSYETDVYYGGLSRFENGQLAQYEFIADAYTGSIMDIYKI